METLTLLGSLMGLSFVAGIRLYATVFVVGLGIKAGLLHLDPRLSQLAVLGHPLIVITAGFLCVIELLADKIPWVDSAWDAVHTVLRPLGAVVLAATALGDIDPALRTVVILLCGTVAFSSHAAKAGARLLVNGSPEPFSNLALSFSEDGFSLVALWLAFAHPIAMLVLVLIFIGVVVWFAPKLYRGMRRSARAVAQHLRGGAAEPPASS